MSPQHGSTVVIIVPLFVLQLEIRPDPVQFPTAPALFVLRQRKGEDGVDAPPGGAEERSEDCGRADGRVSDDRREIDGSGGERGGYSLPPHPPTPGPSSASSSSLPREGKAPRGGVGRGPAVQEKIERIRNALHFHRASSNPTGERGEGGGENAGITGVACSALGGGESEVSGDGRHRTSVSVPPVGGGGTGRSRPSSSSDEVPDRSDDGGVGKGDPLGDSGGRISTGAGTTAEDGVRNSEGGSGVAALGRDIARPGEEDRIDGKAASSDGGSDVRDGAGVGEEKRDEEATWAQAGVAADVAADATETERTRDEVAFLRDLQAVRRIYSLFKPSGTVPGRVYFSFQTPSQKFLALISISLYSGV